MPRYDFQCGRCDDVREATSTDPIDCAYCGIGMKRKYNFAGSILKGSGWYSVDRRRSDGGTIGIEDPN